MNLALFLTKDNLPSMQAAVADMADKQQALVNGALIVVHDSNLAPADIAFTLPLARHFKTSASLPSPIPSGSDAVQMSALFSRFLTAAYTRYPGPWLIFDEPALPKCDNFMQELLRQHGKYGGRMTGRATIEQGSATPIGPVTLELDFKSLKFLRYPTKQSWRERGQFLFARAGFQLVPAEEWLFSMKRVEATQVNAALPRINPAYITPDDNISDDDLRQLIEAASGKRPHHFTGRDKLLSMARELSLAPA